MAASRPLPAWNKTDLDPCRPVLVAGEEDQLRLDPVDDGQRHRLKGSYRIVSFE